MGTTRIKVIDLSSDQQEIKTSRKHAEKLSGSLREASAAKVKKTKGTKGAEESKIEEELTPVIAIPSEAREKQSEEKIATSSQDSTRNDKKETRTATKTSIHHRGKKYQEAAKLIDKNQSYPPKEAIDLLYKTSTVKFDPTVEVHLIVNDKNIRGKVNFPHTVGAKKEKKYLVFSAKKTDAKNVIWGSESSIAEIESGRLKPGRDFDAVITTASFMPQLAKVAKILGPKGMMPSPKTGTISDDPLKAIASESDGAYEFRTDPTAPIIHTKIGKLSNKSDALEENLKVLIAAVGPTKIRKAVIKSTMSPAIKFDITSIAAS